MFATRLQPRLNMFSCEIYLQKQCKLFLSFALSLLLFLCDCGALSSPRKKKHSRDLSDLSVTWTWWRDCTKSFACTRSLYNNHAIIFVVIEYMMVGLFLLQLLNRLCNEQKRNANSGKIWVLVSLSPICLLPSWLNFYPWLPGAERK